jgi:hypothetical protein
MGKDGAANKLVAILQHVNVALKRAAQTDRIAGSPNEFRNRRLSNASQEQFSCPDALRRLYSLYSVETAQQ